MARTPIKRIGVNSDAALNTIYTVGAGLVTTGSILAFTNKTAVSISIDIYTNDGTSDFLQQTMTLPSGIGRRRSYFGFQRDTLLAGNLIKIQADSTSAFNFNLTGSEVEIT